MKNLLVLRMVVVGLFLLSQTSYAAAPRIGRAVIDSMDLVDLIPGSYLPGADLSELVTKYPKSNLYTLLVKFHVNGVEEQQELRLLVCQQSDVRDFPYHWNTLIKKCGEIVSTLDDPSLNDNIVEYYLNLHSTIDHERSFF